MADAEAERDDKWLKRSFGLVASVQLGGLRVTKLVTEEGRRNVYCSAVGKRLVVVAGYQKMLRKSELQWSGRRGGGTTRKVVDDRNMRARELCLSVLYTLARPTSRSASRCAPADSRDVRRTLALQAERASLRRLGPRHVSPRHS
jgi:hypothetical protein